MKETACPPLLTVLAILLSGCWTEGSPHGSIVLRPHPVSLKACRAFPVSSNYCSFVSGADTNATGDEPCRFTLPQHACGLASQVSNVTSGELAAVLQCALTEQAAQADQEAFLLLFRSTELQMLQAALDKVNAQVPRDGISQASKTFLLTAAWERLKTDPRVQLTGFLASWFQETMHSYLTAVNSDILDCMTQLPITCDGFAAVIRALDSAYSGMSNSTRQQVANWIGRFLIIHQCQEGSAKEWIRSNWKSFLSYASYNDLTKTWSGFDGFAALDALTAPQLAQLTSAHEVLSNTSLTEAVAGALASRDILFTEAYLNELGRLPLGASLDRRAMYLMLETILTKVNKSFPDLCSPSLKDLFQVKLTMLLPVADAKILELFPTQISCADFHDIYKGINSVYHELNPITQMSVFKNRLNFLERQFAKEGAACTFAASSSAEWLRDNFGLSSRFAAYGDLARLNPSFDGFDVLDLLTATQIGALVATSGLLTGGTRASAESEAADVMEVLQSRNTSELRAFLLEANKLAEQNDVTEITNVKVRAVMLQDMFQILVPHFASTAGSDFEFWFSGILALYLPSVTPELLGALPSLQNCTQLHTIAKGLDGAFAGMSWETKTGVAQWILRVFRKIGCQTTDNWMSHYFQRFKSLVNITDLMAISPNFSGVAHLGDLSAVQLAQLTLTEEVLGDVTKVEMVFARLAQLPDWLSELAAFWDEFNVAYEKTVRRAAASWEARLRVARSASQPTFANKLNISMRVKEVMLAKTVERLRGEFPAWMDARYQEWFEKRLVLVLPGVTAPILQQIPITISCEAYASVIAGINRGFSEIPEERKIHVFNYIVSFVTQKSQTTGPACSSRTTTRNWLLAFFGRFSGEASYLQLASYYRQAFDAYSVLDLLTPAQIGDMMVHSGTLTSTELALQLVAFFEESTLDHVQKILKEFTRAAVQRRTAVLPDAEVGRLLLRSYLALAAPRLETYTAADWNATLQGELRFLTFAVNADTLAYIVPQNYECFSAIVAGLSASRSRMAESSRRAVVLWIVKHLKALKGYSVEPVPEQIGPEWGSFFPDATLKEVRSTNEDFEPLPLLSSLTIDQLIEFVMVSDAMVNRTTMSRVLLSLETGRSGTPLATLDAFLKGFNLALEQKNVSGIKSAEVRLEMLRASFACLARHFHTFTALDYETWFARNLRFLLPSITEELLQLIPLDIGFPAYGAVFGSLDRVYSELPPRTSLHIYQLMKAIMEKQLNISGTLFPGTYNNSQSFLQRLFYRFIPFATYAEFLALYKDFNGYEVLPLLSPKQLGEMLVLTGAFKDELRGVQILVELEKWPSPAMRDFTIAFNAAAKQKHLTVLPDRHLRDLMLRTVLRALPFSTFSAEQYSFWFGTQLRLFLAGLTSRDLQLIPHDIDCQSHQNLVKALDQVYDHFTDEQKAAVHERIFSYLESYQMEQGATCSPNASSSEWLLSNYGRFRAFGSIAQFLAVNARFRGVSAMAELSADQLADLAVESGALADERAIVTIMSHLDTAVDLGKFLDRLNAVAALELQSGGLPLAILSTAFRRIAVHFPTFKASDFAYWFQVAFRNVLHAVNETLVAELPLRIPCSSYWQILKGFNNVFISIPPQTGPSIFGFSKAFLTSNVKSGVACGQAAQSVRGWLQSNLGNFSRYAEYQELLRWNQRFDGMAVLEYLSPSQLASLTLESGAISEEQKMCQILARLQNKPLEEVYQYLDRFNAVAQKLAITSLKEEGIRKNMLSQFLEEIGPAFSAFDPGNWTHLLSSRLALFLPSVGAEEAAKILSGVSGCNSFSAVVSSLSQVHHALPPASREAVYRALFTFLDSQREATGSACASRTGGTEAWLWDNLGAFAAQAPYEDFTTLRADFDGLSVQGNLTATQRAHLFFASDLWNDPDTVRALVKPLEDSPPGDTVAFVTEFAALASQNGVTFLANSELRDPMFEAIFSKVQILLTTASPSQYKDWFQNKLALWLPSINAPALAALPTSMPCGVFRVVIAGLDASFPRMPPKGRQDVYNFAKAYLATRLSQGGDPCTENTRGSLGWLRSNLGSFSALASYADLVGLNEHFSAMDAVAALTPSQLADCALASGALWDTEKAAKVLGALGSRDIGAFMDAFNAAAEQRRLTRLPHAEAKRFVLGEIFCRLSGTLERFAADDYAAWFGRRLRLFLGSLDARSLSYLPSEMACDSLAAVVKALRDHQANSTFENPEEIVTFIKRVLHFQVENSGSACTGGVSTDREWLEKYFGPLAALGSYADFVALKSDFQGKDSLDLLSAAALAHLTMQSHTVYSSSAITRVFQAIGGKEDPDQFLSTYLDEFNALLLKNQGLLSSVRVRDTMLLLSAEILFPQFAALALEEATAWLQKLGPLLPGTNATTLELLPPALPCPHYQAIVNALDNVYAVLSAPKRQAVLEFQKAYLAAQFADSGSACDQGTTGIRDWLMKNLGRFCSGAKLSDLQAFYPQLDGMENPRALSPAEAADLTLAAQALHNATLASMAVGLIKDFGGYASLREYLSGLRAASCRGSRPAAAQPGCDATAPAAAALSPETQRALLQNVLLFLKKGGGALSSAQRAEALRLLLATFAPALEASSAGTCAALQAAMEIVVLQPGLTEGQGELAELNDFCIQHWNRQLNSTAPAQVTRGTTEPIPEGATPGPRGSRTTHITEPTAGMAGGSATQTLGRGTPSTSERTHGGAFATHTAGSTIRGLRGSAASSPTGGRATRAPGGATSHSSAGAAAHRPGEVPSTQGRPGNTAGGSPGSAAMGTAGEATGGLPGGAATLMPGGSTGDTSSGPAADNPGGTIGRIPPSTPSSIPASYASASATTPTSRTAATHSSGGSGREIPGGTETHRPGGPAAHTPGSVPGSILEGAADYVLGRTTRNMLGGASDSIPKGTTGKFPEDDTGSIPGDAADVRPHSPADVPSPMPRVSPGSISRSTSGNSPGRPTVNISRGSMGHVPRSSTGNISGGATVNASAGASVNTPVTTPGSIPGDATQSIPGHAAPSTAGGVTTQSPADVPSPMPRDTTGNTSRSTSGNSPGRTTVNLSGGTMGPNPRGTISNVPGGPTANIPRDITGNIPGEASGSLIGGVRTLSPAEVPTPMPRHTTGKIAGNTAGSFSRSTSGNFSGRPADHIPRGTTAKIPRGITGDISAGTMANIPGGTTGSVPRGSNGNTAGGLMTHIPRNVPSQHPGGAAGNFSAGVTGNIPGASPGDVPKGTVASIVRGSTSTVPGGTKANIPRSTADNAFTGKAPGGTAEHILGHATANHLGGAAAHILGNGTSDAPGDASGNSPEGTSSSIASGLPGNDPDGSATSVPGVPNRSPTAGAGTSTAGATAGPATGNATSSIPGGATTLTRNCPFRFACCMLLVSFFVTFLS